jgi:Fe2+ or Zn2+ uptake regulation protein
VPQGSLPRGRSNHTTRARSQPRCESQAYPKEPCKEWTTRRGPTRPGLAPRGTIERPRGRWVSLEGDSSAPEARTLAYHWQPQNGGVGAEQLYQDLGGERGPIGRATVYRTVDLLLADHWLARVHWSPNQETTSDDHAYMPVEQGHQHQLVCRACGSVATFEGCEIDALLGGLAR